SGARSRACNCRTSITMWLPPGGVARRQRDHGKAPRRASRQGGRRAASARANDRPTTHLVVRLVRCTALRNAGRASYPDHVSQPNGEVPEIPASKSGIFSTAWVEF